MLPFIGRYAIKNVLPVDFLKSNGLFLVIHGVSHKNLFINLALYPGNKILQNIIFVFKDNGLITTYFYRVWHCPFFFRIKVAPFNNTKCIGVNIIKFYPSLPHPFVQRLIPPKLIEDSNQFLLLILFGMVKYPNGTVGSGDFKLGLH